MHSKHGTTIICADHTNGHTKSRDMITHSPSLAWFPLLIPWSKKKKKNIHLWHIWVWYYGYEILVRFLRVLSTSYLMHYDLLSIWGWEGACPQNTSNWQLGVLKNKTEWGQIFYSITYLIDVGAILYLLTKNLFLKVAWEWSDHQDLKVALTPVYFNDKVKLK